MQYCTLQRCMSRSIFRFLFPSCCSLCGVSSPGIDLLLGEGLSGRSLPASRPERNCMRILHCVIIQRYTSPSRAIRRPVDSPVKQVLNRYGIYTLVPQDSIHETTSVGASCVHVSVDPSHRIAQGSVRTQRTFERVLTSVPFAIALCFGIRMGVYHRLHELLGSGITFHPLLVNRLHGSSFCGSLHTGLLTA